MALVTYNLDEEEQKLEGFLMAMVEEGIDFVEQAQAQGYHLNNEHSLASLEELERYVREEKATFSNPADKSLDQRSNCWYYLGEVVRQNFGGAWQFSMNEENTMHWGAYVLVGHSPVQGVEFKPLGLLKRFILRGYRAGALRKAITAQVNPIPLDLSEFPTEADE
jgi:hypothetical protein